MRTIIIRQVRRMNKRMERKKILQYVVEACDDRKAENCIVLDMQQLTPIADYFVICHGNNERQVQAITRSVKDALEENGHEVKRIEGFDEARWVLLDVGTVVCHIFHKDERSYYNLERLWGDATHIAVEDMK